MEYVISIFVLGLMVSLLVLKGLFAAQEFAKEDAERRLRREKAE